MGWFLFVGGSGGSLGHTVSQLVAQWVGWWFGLFVRWCGWVVWLVGEMVLGVEVLVGSWVGRWFSCLASGSTGFWFGGSVTWWDGESLGRLVSCWMVGWLWVLCLVNGSIGYWVPNSVVWWVVSVG